MFEETFSMLKHALSGLAVIAMAGAIAGCAGPDPAPRHVVYRTAPAAVVMAPRSLTVFERAGAVVYDPPANVAVVPRETVVVPRVSAVAPATTVTVPRETVVVPHETVVVDSNQVVVFQPAETIVVRTLDDDARGKGPYFR